MTEKCSYMAATSELRRLGADSRGTALCVSGPMPSGSAPSRTTAHAACCVRVMTTSIVTALKTQRRAPSSTVRVLAGANGQTLCVAGRSFQLTPAAEQRSLRSSLVRLRRQRQRRERHQHADCADCRGQEAVAVEIEAAGPDQPGHGECECGDAQSQRTPEQAEARNGGRGPWSRSYRRGQGTIRGF